MHSCTPFSEGMWQTVGFGLSRSAFQTSGSQGIERHSDILLWSVHKNLLFCCMIIFRVVNRAGICSRH
jgi:hypothetical protein